jgi:hypothetical protein
LVISAPIVSRASVRIRANDAAVVVLAVGSAGATEVKIHHFARWAKPQVQEQLYDN